jgi:hypothetical protein
LRSMRDGVFFFLMRLEPARRIGQPPIVRRQERISGFLLMRAMMVPRHPIERSMMVRGRSMWVRPGMVSLSRMRPVMVMVRRVWGRPFILWRGKTLAPARPIHSADTVQRFLRRFKRGVGRARLRLAIGIRAEKKARSEGDCGGSTFHCPRTLRLEVLQVQGGKVAKQGQPCGELAMSAAVRAR